jgi:hypothetical protein
MKQKTGKTGRRGVTNSFRGRTYERGKWGGENSQSHKLDNNYLPSVCYFLFGFPVTECVTVRNVERIFEMKYLLAPLRPKKSSFSLPSIGGKVLCFSRFNYDFLLSLNGTLEVLILFVGTWRIYLK